MIFSQTKPEALFNRMEALKVERFQVWNIQASRQAFEVLRLLAERYSNREFARVLHLSVYSLVNKWGIEHNSRLRFLYPAPT